MTAIMSIVAGALINLGVWRLYGYPPAKQSDAKGYAWLSVSFVLFTISVVADPDGAAWWTIPPTFLVCFGFAYGAMRAWQHLEARRAVRNLDQEWKDLY